jgi:hypothetical protein
MSEEIKSISDDDLVSELWARDVRFLMGKQENLSPLLSPSSLIASLAQSENARVRLALIPLFLRHPEFSNEVKKADNLLSSEISKLFLRFYYTAAIILQRKYQERINNILGEQIKLPDLYSNALGISLEENPEKDLVHLGKQHQILSGHIINWIGTYEHGAGNWLKYMELQYE